jgi:hypothetical protein
MREVHLHIDEVVLDGVDVGDPEEFRVAFVAALTGLAQAHAGEYPSGRAFALNGSVVTAPVHGADVARSVWHSMVPVSLRSGGGVNEGGGNL